MSESRLQDIKSHNSLSCEKRRVVSAFILSGLIMGTVYLAAKSYLVPNDMIMTQDDFVKVPAVR